TPSVTPTGPAGRARTPTRTPTRTSTPTYTRTNTLTPTRTNTPAGNAFLVLMPAQGACTAPPNGGSVNVGCIFELDLCVNSGSQVPQEQRSYMPFTYQLLQNVTGSGRAANCVLTNTITADTTYFDDVTQNEVCNGPNPCNY